MTVSEAARPGGPTRTRELLQHRELRRLLGWLGGGVLLAVMTGPQGVIGQPTYAISHALRGGHLVTCLVVGVVMWGLSVGWSHGRESVHAGLAEPRAQLRTAWEQPAVRRGFYLVLLALAIFLPRLTGQFWQGVLVEQIGIYALLALGLNIVVGFAGLLDLGYVAFYAIGAYTTAYFTDTLPVHPPFTINPFLVIPFAVLAAMLAGLILGAPTLRLRGDYLAIVTLGFGEIITILAVNLDSITNGSRGAFGIPSFSIRLPSWLGGWHYEWGLSSLPYYYLLLGFTVTILVLFHLLENSRVGRAWVAIREDEVAAQACGIPPVKYKLMAFAIGASTSGFAGVLYASKISFINPSSFTVSASILILVLVIFGGMGSLFGSVVGAAVVQWFFKYVQKNNGAPIPLIHKKLPIDVQDLYMYVGALLILMMIFRPQGIVPSRRRAREISMAEHGIGGADAMAAPVGSPTP
ncbi:MAG: branched-chain amino acid ABC transporter permease [Frankiales bacterium]|nr:branched-chain amino acid ABC transporter permease [Frankiales bacterium]